MPEGAIGEASLRRMLLTEAEFVVEERKCGRALHRHENVWWVRVQPFYCKPLVEFRAFPRNMAKPRLDQALLGYSHQVEDPREANRTVDFMVLDGSNLREFGMQPLRAEKRNQVRKGLKQCEIRLITDMEAQLEAMRRINMSQADRQGRVDVPASYYVRSAEEWRMEKRLEFANRGTTWWGAFHESELVGYVVTLGVEDTLFVTAVKSHTDHLKLCPADALHFAVLENAREDPRCVRVVHGGSGLPSLNRFKEQFLFERRTFHYFTARKSLFSAAMRAHAMGESARLWMSRTKGQPDDRSASGIAGAAEPKSQ